MNQEIATLEKGLIIEYQRHYAKQASFTYLYGMPLNLLELENRQKLFDNVEILYLDPIGEANFMLVQYRGGSNRVMGDKIISCTVRGDLGSRPKAKRKSRRSKNIITM